MNVKRLVPHFAWRSGWATFTAACAVAPEGTRQLAQGSATLGPVASVPDHAPPHARPAAGSSTSTDSALLAMMGGIALALGLAVYLTDRDPSHAALIPVVAGLAGSNLFGPLGRWLPAAVHPFAFSLFTAAALPSRSAWRFGACAAWCVVNIAFELGQHPLIGRHVVAALPVSSSQSVPGGMVANYFLNGTFDGTEVVATVLGALAAAAVLRRLHQVREKHHEQ